MREEMTTNDAPWPILVLTLPGDKARRAPLIEALERAGLPFELFHGVDGRQGLDERWEQEIDRAAPRQTFGHDMTDGEFACALSHREIYRMVVEQGWPGAVVLEDDAILNKHFAAFVRGRHYDHAELVLLDHYHARVRDMGKEILPGVMLRRLVMSPFRTSGYSVSASAAQALLEAASPVRRFADWPLDIAELGAMAVNPRIVAQPEAKPGNSHLREGRNQRESEKRKHTRSWRRWRTRAYWRRWITKRRSTRIS